MSGTLLSVGLVCGLFAACAGETTPDVDDELRDGIEVVYGGEAVAAAGAGQGSNDDDDDDGNAGRGGSASANAGAGGAGDDDDNAGGAAGSAMAAAGAGGGGGAGGLVSAGGAGGGGATGAVCNGFAVIQTNCGGGSCHGTGSNLGTFAVSEAEFRSYIGEEGVICSGQGPLIDPANPEDSVLVLKLADDVPCGQPMPQGPTRLPQADVDCIAEWIGSLE